jgi:hypothetical protein
VPRPGKVVVGGVLCYLATSVIYYLLFNYSLNLAGTTVSERADIPFNILKKVSFFISDPLPSAFSLKFYIEAIVFFYKSCLGS